MTKEALKTKIRVGQISYTNCLPFYHNLTDFEFTRAVPAEINEAMRQGRMDVAPISSLEYLMNAKDYYLLPQLGIGARDFSGSVILFSREKIGTLNGSEIAVTRESLSSAALLKILLKLNFKFENQFKVMPSEPDEMLKSYKAALVIGDSALFYQPKDFIYKYDLAELWWNWTHKPFCFAVWAVRKEFAEEFPEDVAFFWKRLKETAAQNLSHVESLVQEATGLTRVDEKFPKVLSYLSNLSYDLDADMQTGLEHFYRLAHELALAPKPEKLEFFEWGTLDGYSR